jgi:hypothetical protein
MSAAQRPCPSCRTKNHAGTKPEESTWLSCARTLGGMLHGVRSRAPHLVTQVDVRCGTTRHGGSKVGFVQAGKRITKECDAREILA